MCQTRTSISGKHAPLCHIGEDRLQPPCDETEAIASSPIGLVRIIEIGFVFAKSTFVISAIASADLKSALVGCQWQLKNIIVFILLLGYPPLRKWSGF